MLLVLNLGCACVFYLVGSWVFVAWRCFGMRILDSCGFVVLCLGFVCVCDWVVISLLVLLFDCVLNSLLWVWWVDCRLLCRVFF